MEIIVRGEPQEIDFVQRICRDKVRRGLITILPATRPAISNQTDDKYISISDTKDVQAVDVKEAASPRKPTRRSKKSE